MNFIKIRSKYLGEIEIEGDQTVCFRKACRLLKRSGNCHHSFCSRLAFFYLQAVNNEQLCFILADIFTFSLPMRLSSMTGTCNA